MSSEYVAIVGSLGCLYGVSFLGCLWPVILKCQQGTGRRCPARTCLSPALPLLPWLWGCGRTSGQHHWSGLGPLSPATLQPGNFQRLPSRLAFNSKNSLENLVLLESRKPFPCEASSENFHPSHNHVTCKTGVPSL